MIKKWKDLIPQYVSKSGFSKKKMVSLKIDYIKKFIAETYRAELDHLFCCFVIPIIFFLNTAKLSIILSTIVIICNLPCIIIQRYILNNEEIQEKLLFFNIICFIFYIFSIYIFFPTYKEMKAILLENGSNNLSQELENRFNSSVNNFKAFSGRGIVVGGS